MVDFPKLLERFATAVQENDGAGLGALFTGDGVYDDGFFGEYAGPPAIAAMLQHFHDTGANFRWDFLDPLTDGRIGYARYRFSYAAKIKGAEGKPVVFEGTAFFTFQGDRIARCTEVFDRGVALVQQDFDAERLKKVLARTAARLNAGAGAQEHLARLAAKA